MLEYKGILFWDQEDFPEVPFSNDDEYIQLDPSNVDRIDLVAYEKYGDSELMWILLLANDKMLPNQFVSGEKIRIPARATIDEILSQGKV